MGEIEEELGRIYNLVGELSGISTLAAEELRLTKQPS